MNNYAWNLIDGTRCEISLTDNLESLIIKTQGGKEVESASLTGGSVTTAMPHIMRYCFDKNINLRQREFLRNPPYIDLNIDKFNLKKLKSDFNLPPPINLGTIREFDGNMVVKSYSIKEKRDGSVTFEPEDVPVFIEGLIRSFDHKKTVSTYERSIITVLKYHKLLDSGILK